MRWVINTASDSSKERVVHIHTVFLVEQRLVSTAAPPIAIMSLLKMQCHLLSTQNGHFKWHYFMNNNYGCIHLLFKERNQFGEYHHVFHALRRHPAKFFEYLRMLSDTFDYVLSKVHDSLENQTASRVKNRRSLQSVICKHFWKQINLFLVLLLRCECPVLPIASCLL
jgi:hypothetical protein